MDFKLGWEQDPPFAKSDTIEASDKPWRCRLQQEIWNKSEDKVEILGDFLWYKSGLNEYKPNALKNWKCQQLFESYRKL